MNRLDPVLARGLAAIEPYLDVVVVAGGWVPHIYELLYDAGAASRSPRTRDIDLAVPRSVPVRSRSIDELLKGADFRCEFHSLDSPPVTKYVASQGDGDIEIEFITDAPGASEAAIMVQPDLTAQATSSLRWTRFRSGERRSTRNWSASPRTSRHGSRRA
ncbi:MAG: GSU2403 family nucleotidyltransferase fold protein [Coriobacteriia bacterium]